MWNVGIMVFKTMGHAVILPNLPRSHYGSTPTGKLATSSNQHVFLYSYVEMLTQMNLNPQFSWMMGWWLVEEIILSNTFGSQNLQKWWVLGPKNMGEITHKNEGNAGSHGIY